MHVCCNCNQPIYGQWLQVDGKYFHPEHFVCSHCGFSITTKFNADGTGYYHADCYRAMTSIKCAICHQSINGQYILDLFGNNYHIHHQKEYPSCQYCGILICDSLSDGKPGTAYKDGRKVCARCWETVILNEQTAEKAIKNIRLLLTKWGLHITYGIIPVKIISIDSLRKQCSYPRAVGFASWQGTTNASGKRNINELSISMLMAVPELDFQITTAHELAHLWQFENCCDLEQSFSEGFAEYIAYRTLLKRKPTKLVENLIKRMLENPDPVYGTGLRRAKRFVDQIGLAAFINYHKNNSRFPDHLYRDIV